MNIASPFRKTSLVACLIGAWLLVRGSEQPVVRVQPTDAVGPRVLEKRTEASVIKDYLQAWRSLDGALAQNQAQMLDGYFIGVAKEKLSDTIREQQNLGINTSYKDRAHDIRVGFYSPEGQSLQLLDTVEYDVSIVDHERQQGTQHVRSPYVAVLTPTEVRWEVRVLQAHPETGPSSNPEIESGHARARKHGQGRLSTTRLAVNPLSSKSKER